jgi:hypothetical protein
LSGPVWLSTTAVPVAHARVLCHYVEPVYMVWKRRGRGYFIAYWYNFDPAPHRLYTTHRCHIFP